MLATSILATLSAPAAPEPYVHPERAAQIAEIRAKGATWKAAPHPRFSSQAPGASKPLLGVTGNWAADIMDKVREGEIEPYVPRADIANAAIPDAFDSAANWPMCAKTIGDIRDQSNCGCCWAFAGAEAASDRMCISSQGKMLMPLSAEDVCFNPLFTGGCNGGQISTPWSFIKRVGAVTGGNYNATGAFGGGWCSAFSLPHCHHHGPQGDDPYPAEGQPGCPHENTPPGPKACDATAKSEHSDFKGDKITYSGKTQSASGVEQVQQMIMEGGPVETAFTVYSDFENYAGGVYQHKTGQPVGGHAVKIVGWGVDGGVKYWKIANSWNPYWGEKGYFRIAHGEGGIDSMVVGSAADAQYSNKH
jgi:cathepsin B